MLLFSRSSVESLLLFLVGLLSIGEENFRVLVGLFGGLIDLWDDLRGFISGLFGY